MNCCESHCAATAKHFGDAAAERDRTRYRKKGPDVFRVFVHPAAEPESTVLAAGFRRLSRAQTWTWCADLYVREPA